MKDLPADQDVGHSGPFHRAVAAESKAGLTVDVLRVAHVRAIVALIDGHVYSRSLRVRLQNKRFNRDPKGFSPSYQSERVDVVSLGIATDCGLTT